MQSDVRQHAFLPRPGSDRGQGLLGVAIDRFDRQRSSRHGSFDRQGADLYTLLCECMGREDGYSKGRGGKMHMGDMAFGFIGNTGTVGGTVPTATGAAVSAKVRGSQEVVVSFVNDGAANQGVVHESINLLGAWKVPVIYVCENNQYAMTVGLEKSVAMKQLSVRGAADSTIAQSTAGRRDDSRRRSTCRCGEALGRRRKDRVAFLDASIGFRLVLRRRDIG